MPRIQVVFFKDDDESVPVLDWIRGQREKRVAAKCHAVIGALGNNGHDLRRPISDYLRDDIHELRIRFGHINYRILYFFHGKEAAILAVADTKEDKVDDRLIDRAAALRAKFFTDPERYTYHEEY